jgi:hypothetical protein
VYSITGEPPSLGASQEKEISSVDVSSSERVTTSIESGTTAEIIV